jgi:hypothetical protein
MRRVYDEDAEPGECPGATGAPSMKNDRRITDAARIRKYVVTARELYSEELTANVEDVAYRMTSGAAVLTWVPAHWRRSVHTIEIEWPRYIANFGAGPVAKAWLYVDDKDLC